MMVPGRFLTRSSAQPISHSEAPALIVFAVTLTFASFDWVMSLDPRAGPGTTCGGWDYVQAGEFWLHRNSPYLLPGAFDPTPAAGP